MYHHTRALMAWEASMRLNLCEETLTDNESSYTNNGCFSPEDTVKNMEIGQKKILNYIKSLIGKEQIITVSKLSKELNMPEEFIVFVLKKNKLVEV